MPFRLVHQKFGMLERRFHDLYLMAFKHALDRELTNGPTIRT
jgi:hypothetical protein